MTSQERDTEAYYSCFFGITFIRDEDTDILVLNATDGSLDIHTSVTGTQ